MITEKVIEKLYKTYKNRPSNADELDISLLFETLIDNHEIAIDDEANLIINSIDRHSPFHKIPLSHIHAIVEFEHKIAIVLHSSIIFLNKSDNRTHIHIRQRKNGIFNRIFNHA
ncbi:MAG: hypothetical protein NC111_05990 [Bacteroides sp.]|nr:hypothetical protein [Bacteroides sp.]MCM1413199.1 hypothetical protein [Bacteroides sp.]MCM1472059.1 hypothetical protein [Bacteroides sp.]